MIRAGASLRLLKRQNARKQSLGHMLGHALRGAYERTSSKMSRAYATKKKRERVGAPNMPMQAPAKLCRPEHYAMQPRVSVTGVGCHSLPGSRQAVRPGFAKV